MRYPLLYLLLAGLLIGGCTGISATPTAVPTPTPTPRELIVAIGKATQATQSVHFVVEMSGKPVAAEPSGTFSLVRVEGDLKSPDGALATVRVRSVAGIADVRTVSLPNQQYLTNPITRQWQCVAPGTIFDPAVLFDPNGGVAFLFQESFANATLVATEELNGRPHYRLSGTIAGEPLRNISFGSLGVGTVNAEVWADTATMRAAKVMLVDTGSDPANPSTWIITFSDYDKTVDLRAPITC